MNKTENASDDRFRHWLLEGVKEIEGPHEKEGTHQKHSWWQVMCLTGLDYFSTLGYQPGIAFIAAGVLSPIATLVLVLLTLFGAYPIYSRVAAESPHGEGSISMLEALFSRWKSKLFVLVLLGFVATDFVITITLSAADATAHILENPFVHDHLPFLEHPILVTLVLIALLGAVFLKGFKEAIGIAVVLVAVFLLLNLVVIGFGIYEVFTHPELLANWKTALFTNKANGGARSVFMIIGLSLLVFPKLALGLSGFETGVAVMPLVKNPNRIANTRKLLATAALIMSFMLICSSFMTSVLIPEKEFCPKVACDDAHAIEEMPQFCQCGEEKGKANGRALAYIAHENFGAAFGQTVGNVFGTIYDISTILILWFAGASAMAGLLNIVPRYLPRYGMAPDWARATRPLTMVFIAICFAVTIVFKADVDAQGGAYATGVLVLMSSAAIAVTLSAWRKRNKRTLAYLAIALVFAYTTIANIIERPDGIKIASLFIFGIIAASFISRAMRTTEVRIDKIELDATAKEFIDELIQGEIRIVTNRLETGDVEEYRFKEHEKRVDNHIPSSDPILFYEITLGDASEFTGKLVIHGVDIEGYKILRTESPAVPNAIAALLLHLRDKTGKIPHVYFGWSEGNPIAYLIRYILFGEGDTAPVTREILRQAEQDPELRPNVHVGG
ncbi:MAG: amino acid transporter [Acidobacteriota bacterium]|nr:amino acid transporter [Acidobacteriota bacterium]